jgi:hypothetical protein
LGVLSGLLLSRIKIWALLLLSIFFAARGGIRGINDKFGGVGSHDLDNSPTK